MFYVRFSIELLLGLIEMNQFKKNIQDTGMQTIGDGVSDSVYTLEFADSVPLSSIIETKWNEDKVKDIKTKAHHIYNKYVKEGCLLEINISYTQRHDLMLILDDLNRLIQNECLDLKELFTLFDDVIDELVKMQKLSINRFMHEDEFFEVKFPSQMTV